MDVPAPNFLMSKGGADALQEAGIADAAATDIGSDPAARSVDAPRAAKSGPSPFSSIIGALSSVKDSASRATQVALLKHEVAVRDDKVKSIKRRAGARLYDSMAAGDTAETTSIFEEARGRVEVLESEMAARRAEIQRLWPSGASTSSDDTPTSPATRAANACASADEGDEVPPLAPSELPSVDGVAGPRLESGRRQAGGPGK